MCFNALLCGFCSHGWETPASKAVLINTAGGRAGSRYRRHASLSPAFPTGSYSYSHGLEWAIESHLIPLGQTDGQRAFAGLEHAVLEASERALTACIDDLGSAALMVDFASMLHETQYTRLFRS